MAVSDRLTWVAPDGATWRFHIRADGRLHAVTDPRGLQWTIDHDPEARIVRVIDPLGLFEEWSYDERGRVGGYRDRAGVEQPIDRSTASIPSTAGPALASNETRVDLANREVGRRDPDGRWVEFELDRVGDVTSVAVDGSTVVAFERDGAGRVRRLYEPATDHSLAIDWPSGTSVMVDGQPTCWHTPESAAIAVPNHLDQFVPALDPARVDEAPSLVALLGALAAGGVGHDMLGTAPVPAVTPPLDAGEVDGRPPWWLPLAGPRVATSPVDTARHSIDETHPGADAPRRYLEALLGSALPADSPLPIDQPLADSRSPRPAYTLTSGSGLEASVSGGQGTSSGAVRYTIDLAADRPFLAERLAAQEAALTALIERLPAEAQEPAHRELGSVADCCFPDRTRLSRDVDFGIWLGIEHANDDPTRVSVLKVYGNLTGDPDAHRRVGERWPEVASLADRLPLDLVTPRFLAVQIDRTGHVNHKLYVAPAANGEHQAVAELAEIAGVDFGMILDELARCGLADALWGPWVKPCLQATTGRPLLTLHLATTPVIRAGDDVMSVARQAAYRHHGTTDHFDRAWAAATATGRLWRLTVLALGFGPDGPTKFTVYLAPDHMQSGKARGS